MMNFLKWFLPHTNVVESLTALRKDADNEYVSALEIARKRYGSVIKFVEDEAHTELEAIKALIAHSAGRIATLTGANVLHNDHVDEANAIHEKLNP